MNLKQIQCCLELYYAKNYHTAARNLFVTQPALTQQIQRIEAELGVQIFNRSGKTVSVTREGEAVIAAFQSMQHSYSQLEARIADAKSLRRSHLTIGVPPIRALQFLPVILPAFRRRYPYIELSVQETASMQLAEDLKNGTVDLGFMLFEEAARGMDFLPLVREERFLITMNGSESDQKYRENTILKHPLDIELLKDEPFILLPKESNSRKQAELLFQRFGIHPPIIFEAQTAELAIALASQGMGNSIATGIALYFARDRYQPRCYSLSHVMSPFRAGIVIHPEHYRSAAMEVFISFCRETLEKYPFYEGEVDA